MTRIARRKQIEQPDIAAVGILIGTRQYAVRDHKYHISRLHRELGLARVKLADYAERYALRGERIYLVPAAQVGRRRAALVKRRLAGEQIYLKQIDPGRALVAALAADYAVEQPQ